MSLKSEILETEAALASNKAAKAEVDKRQNELFDEGTALQRNLDALKAALYDSFAAALAANPSGTFSELGAVLDASAAEPEPTEGEG